MRRPLPLRVLPAAVAVGLLLAAAPAVTAPDPDAVVGDGRVIRSGPLEVRVATAPFGLVVTQAGEEVLSSAPADPVPLPGASSDLPEVPGFAATGPLSFALGAGGDVHQLGYGGHAEVDVAWFHATEVTQVVEAAPGRVRLRVATDAPDGRHWTVTVEDRAPGTVAVLAELSDTTGVVATAASFDNGADQHFVGFGERSDNADQTGEQVVSWNEEGPFSAGDLRPVTDPVFGEAWQGPAFFPGSNFTMPWFLSSRGYGFLLDSDWLNGFDLGSDDPSVWRVTTREPQLRFRLYGGPRPATALARFTTDTGRQPEPAPWFFGPWVQPGPGPSWFVDNDVPVTVAQTYAHYLPCAAQDGRRDQLRDQVADWHAHGARITTYVNSFVCNDHPQGAWEEGDAAGHFLRHAATGATYPVPYVAYVEPDGVHHGVVDFTSPAATEFWQGLVDEAIEDGYDGWMEDFGEYVPVDATTSDGRSGLAYHNRYCTDYHRASHALTWPRKGRDFAAFVRCGYTGTAPYARIVWGADPSEDFSQADGLAAAVSQALSIGASGIGYWGSDIGGFHALFHAERTDVELQSRWVAFGAFSGIMRTQRTGYPRPGPDTYTNDRAEVFDPEMVDRYRRFARLRMQLAGEFWEAADAYQRTGLPMMRHLGLVDPEAPESWDEQAAHEFLLGDDLLVAPVVTPGATTRDVWLPDGQWVDFWQLFDQDAATGAISRSERAAEVLPGRTSVRVDAPLDRIPLFVRAGACLDLLDPTLTTLAELGATTPGVTTPSEAPGTRTVCAA